MAALHVYATPVTGARRTPLWWTHLELAADICTRIQPSRTGREPIIL